MRIVLQRRWAAPAAPPARVVVSFHHSGGLRAEPLEASQLGTSHTLILEGNLAILAGFADYVGEPRFRQELAISPGLKNTEWGHHADGEATSPVRFPLIFRVKMCPKAPLATAIRVPKQERGVGSGKRTLCGEGERRQQ